MKKMIFLNENIFILKRIRRDETGMTLLFLILLIVLKYSLYKSYSLTFLFLPVGTVDSIADIVVDIEPIVEHCPIHFQNYKFEKQLVVACLNIQ